MPWASWARNRSAIAAVCSNVCPKVIYRLRRRLNQNQDRRPIAATCRIVDLGCACLFAEGQGHRQHQRNTAR
jgi:hypothetical protein